MSFDLPEGKAIETLRNAALQGEIQILFSDAVVDGVMTKAIRGRYTPREALDLMLEGTGLDYAQATTNGAYAITIAESENEASGSDEINPTTQTDSQDKIETEMNAKNNNWPKTFVAALTLAILGNPGDLRAQNEEEDQPIYDLSPFVVDESETSGYFAPNTLAGTRLKTPIKDLGASISIYTKEFMEDIGATSSSELLIYATGMEAAGVVGNFSGASDSVGQLQVNPQGPRVNPQGGSRTRGLSSPSFTRNYFNTDIPIDSYNVDSVTVNRGPNAILFGVGSPAGVVEQTSKRALTYRDINQVEFRYGDNDSLRGRFDINRVLIEDKLALRVAAVEHRERYEQEPAFENNSRLFAALTWSPTNTTALRANYETGDSISNRPITVLPFKSVQDEWFVERPTFDWTFFDDPAKNPDAASINGNGQISPLLGNNVVFNHIASVYPDPSSTEVSNSFRTQIRGGNANQANRFQNNVFHPVFNRDSSNDGFYRFLGTTSFMRQGAAFWTQEKLDQFGLVGQVPGQRPAGIKNQGFTDFEAFDWANRMIDETSRQSYDFDAFNISFEQRAWEDRLGIELAYDRQDYERHARNSFFASNNGNHITIDPNVFLPTGELNPNLGRPFTFAGQFSNPNLFTERENFRATAFISYDFSDLDSPVGAWLGKHTLTGLYQRENVDTLNFSTSLATAGDAALTVNTNLDAFARRPIAVVYLGPSVVGNNNPLQLNPIKIPPFTANQQLGNATYFSREPGAENLGELVTAPHFVVERANTVRANREVIKSKAAVLQSYWLKDHVVTVFGWRRDEDFFAEESIPFQRNPNDPNDPGKIDYVLSDFEFPSTPPPNVAADTTSSSVVVKVPNPVLGVFGLSEKAEVSLFYNKSDNFTPIGGRIDAFGDSLPSPKGQTEEWGFNIFGFNDTLSLRVNQFKTSVTNANASSQKLRQAANNGVAQAFDFIAAEANRNPENAAWAASTIETLLSPLPDNFPEVYSFKVEGEAPNIIASHVTPSGITDTSDFVSEGTELELVYNPTRNWRILANVAKQETVQSNSNAGLRDFVELMRPAWDQIDQWPRGGFAPGFGPDNPDPNAATFRDWLDTNIYVPLATFQAAEGSASAEQRKWRANLVANYSFSEGVLRGWSAGGGIRWQDKVGIGYPTTVNPDGSVNIDIDNPFWAPDTTNVDLRIGYTRKIFDDKVTMKLQLHVRNIIADDDLIPIGIQPWGEPSTVRLAPEKRWYLTSTFDF